VKLKIINRWLWLWVRWMAGGGQGTTSTTARRLIKKF